MHRLAMAYALIAAVMAWNAAVAQTNPSQPSYSGSPQTAGQGDIKPGQAAKEAPVGHRQPKAKDVPPGVQENLGVRSPEDRAIDRKLRICRDC